MNEAYSNHYEETTPISASPQDIFIYADEPMNFSSHMNTSSWMMMGSKMETKTDGGKGKKVGSHIQMNGTILGVNLFLDEVITIHEPPYRKAWRTVGKINLLVIDHYTLGFEISSKDDIAIIKVYIDYDLPKTWKTRWLGVLLGSMYTKWCVQQMLNGVKNHFKR